MEGSVPLYLQCKHEKKDGEVACQWRTKTSAARVEQQYFRYIDTSCIGASSLISSMRFNRHLIKKLVDKEKQSPNHGSISHVQSYFNKQLAFVLPQEQSKQFSKVKIRIIP